MRDKRQRKPISYLVSVKLYFQQIKKCQITRSSQTFSITIPRFIDKNDICDKSFQIHL